MRRTSFSLGSSRVSPHSLLSVVRLLCFGVRPLRAEVLHVWGNIQPQYDRYFSVEELYVQGPGFIDLSNVEVRRVDQETVSTSSSTTVDFAVVHLPRSFRDFRRPFRFHGLRVGFLNDSPSPSELEDFGLWCCTNHNFGRSDTCSQDLNFGRLFLDDGLFDGGSVSVVLPDEGSEAVRPIEGRINLTESGRFLLLIGICNPTGPDTVLKGTILTKSWYGFYPAESVGMMYVSYVLGATSIVLSFAYAFTMMKDGRQYTRTEMIVAFATIAAFMEATLFAAYNYVLNLSAESVLTVFGWAMVAGGIKQGLILVLVLHIARGRRLDCKLICLGAVYLVVTSALRLQPVVLGRSFDGMGNIIRAMDMFQILQCLKLTMNVFIAGWILFSVNLTIRRLHGAQEEGKLHRYIRFRQVVLYLLVSTTAVFAVWVWRTMSLFSGTIVIPHDREWLLDAMWKINEMVVLIGVAMLWWPSPSNQDYESILELEPLHGPISLDQGHSSNDERSLSQIRRRRSGSSSSVHT